MLIDTIRAQRPYDGIDSEELEQAIRGNTPRIWVNDPIDGTKNFASGSPLFGVVVAAKLDGTPDVGVIALPADDTIIGARSLESGVAIYDLSGRRLGHISRKDFQGRLPRQLALGELTVAYDLGYSHRSAQLARLTPLIERVGAPASYHSSSWTNAQNRPRRGTRVCYPAANSVRYRRPRCHYPQSGWRGHRHPRQPYRLEQPNRGLCCRC